VVTTDLRLNEPRYASAAQHHEGEEQAAREQDAGGLRRGHEPAPEDAEGIGAAGAAAGIKVADVDALVAKLKNWE
jgi:hypothetical protein